MTSAREEVAARRLELVALSNWWRRVDRLDGALAVGMVGFLWALALLFRVDAAHPSYAAHFVEQAKSWLAGRADVPPWLGHDLVLVGGRAYIVYPPLPALLMLPFVAALGPRFSDIWFTWLFAGLNVVLLRRLLGALADLGIVRRGRREQAIFAATFGVGTIALWLALGGTVWFTAQTIALSCLLLVLLATARRRWWLVATALGGLFLTRSPDVLIAIIPAVVFARARGWGRRMPVGWSPPPWPRQALSVAIPLAVAGAIWLARNTITFGHPFSSGYDLQIAQDYPQIHYGLLSWRYLWPNAVVAFLNVPAFHFASPFDTTPTLDLARGGNGTSVFFTTPLFLLLFAPGNDARPRYRWLRRTLWGTGLLMITFTLLWNGTGWYQMGARYLVDAYPIGFIALAMRRDAISWRWLALAGAGVTVNVALAETFWHHGADLLAAPFSARGLAYLLALALGPALALAAGWWLRAVVPPVALPQPLSAERLASE